MKSYQILKEEVRRRTLDCRAVEALVNSEEFADDWGKGYSNQIAEWIEEGDIISLKSHLKANAEKENLPNLKGKARKLGIKNWYRLTKYQLVSEIEKYG